MALSPDGKKVALLAHGDVFAGSATEPGEAQRLTTTPAPEHGIRWSPDSNRVLFISGRNRHDQIFEYDLIKSTERQLTNTTEDDAGAEYSPDGKLIAFVREEKELHTLNLETGKDECVAKGVLQLPVVAWSPDSKFIAFTQEGAKSFRNVHLVAADGRNAQPISFLANGQTASGIGWSPDGKYLLFDTAQRSEPSQMARVDLVPHIPAYREDQFRALFRSQQNPDQTPATQPGVPPSKPADVPLPADHAGAPSTLSEKPEQKPVVVRVVFEGIRQRLTFVPLGFDCGKPVISPDGKTLVFLAETGNQKNIYSYSLDELSSTPRSVHQLTSTATPKSDIQFLADSKQIFYLDGGHVTSMSLEAHTPKPLAASASLDIDFDLEKAVAFDEGWSILNQRFFDPEFNHQNWSALHDHYAPYIAGAHTPDEMHRIMNLMIGDLNASHSGVGPAPVTPHPTSPQSPFLPMPTPVGHLGLRFEREPYEAGRGLVIREVIPLSPVALEGTVKAGEQLVAVDHEEIGPHTNLDCLLENKVDRRVVLQIAGANGGAKRDVIVRPVSLATEGGLHYRAWVEANRAYVERVSGGKLGYVHIADMSSESLTQLYIDLDVQNQTKKGVVIDIRSNYGGFVNEYAIDVFTRKNYLLMTRRGSDTAPARPALGQRALGLPTVLVTDQNSLSDAEDFTEGYRELKLGKVVGEPTAGWIIYTNSRSLIDGSVIRVPGVRVQTGDGQPMEMHPRPVDVFVERLPGEIESGHDTQLDRAIQELVAQLARKSA
jgi:C-terminal processing protease CtpA/Prc